MEWEEYLPQVALYYKTIPIEAVEEPFWECDLCHIGISDRKEGK